MRMRTHKKVWYLQSILSKREIGDQFPLAALKQSPFHRQKTEKKAGKMPAHSPSLAYGQKAVRPVAHRVIWTTKEQQPVWQDHIHKYKKNKLILQLPRGPHSERSSLTTSMWNPSTWSWTSSPKYTLQVFSWNSTLDGACPRRHAFTFLPRANCYRETTLRHWHRVVWVDSEKGWAPREASFMRRRLPDHSEQRSDHVVEPKNKPQQLRVLARQTRTQLALD